MLKMEINGKLSLCIQAMLGVVRLIDNMDLESLALCLIGFVLTPFIVGSVWSVGLSIIWQLFQLGMKAGFILFLMSAVYLAYLKRLRYLKDDIVRGMVKLGLTRGDVRKKTADSDKPQERANPKCCLMDIILSVFFQSGLRVPSFIWEFATDFIPDRSDDGMRMTYRERMLMEERQRIARIHDCSTDEAEALSDEETEEDDTTIKTSAADWVVVDQMVTRNVARRSSAMYQTHSSMSSPSLVNSNQVFSQITVADAGIGTRLRQRRRKTRAH